MKVTITHVFSRNPENLTHTIEGDGKIDLDELNAMTQILGTSSVVMNSQKTLMEHFNHGNPLRLSQVLLKVTGNKE